MYRTLRMFKYNVGICLLLIFVYGLLKLYLDSCDCEEFGMPLAKKINNLQLKADPSQVYNQEPRLLISR